MLSTLLFSFAAPFAATAARAQARMPTGSSGTPHTFTIPAAPDRSGPYPGPAPATMRAAPLTKIAHPFVPTMRELVVPLTRTVLTPGQPPTYLSIAAQATSSDGQLRLSVPAGAVHPTDLTGPLSLVVDQVGGISGSTDAASSSGLISLGTYTFQIQNAQGQEASQGFALPMTVVYHWAGVHAPAPFTGNRVTFALNSALPTTLPHRLLHQGKVQQIATTFDATAQTLTAIVPLASSSGGGSFTTPSPVANFGKPDAFQNDLHNGSLTDTIGIDVPSGPGGLTPSLNLSYSSAAVAGTHGASAAAGWVGQGWSLDPGEVSWSETNVPAHDGSINWVDSWTIADPFGTTGQLIPPSTTVATYYDDTVNNPILTPTVWHTSQENYAKIYSYTNTNVDCTNFPQPNKCGHGGYSVQPPCFRVWLKNGIMEEFGCTFDSRQWYPAGSSGTTNYVTTWKLDLITDPSGNQIHYTYHQDMATQNGISYPRDVVLSNVQWDAPACHDPNHLCTGANWNPKMAVNFGYSRTPAVASGATICTQSGALRCDDPQPGAQTPIPLVMSTSVLNDIYVDVNPSGTWSLLRVYVLKYAQSVGSIIVDPYSGQTENTAGTLLLEQITEYGTAGTSGVSYPTQTFKYAIPDAEYYEDGQYTPNANAGCGPAWNTGYNGTCVLWYRTYANEFMTEADNGMGMQATFTWLNMRTNQHGVDTTAPAPDNDPSHPYACTVIQANKTNNWNKYPCSLADDNGWSQITLTSRTEVVQMPLSNKSTNPVTAIWSYNYNLAGLSAQECSDCQYGMYWGNANDGDVLGFYNGENKGFAFAQSVNPDASLAGSRAIPLASSYGDESAVAVATPYLLLTAFYLW